MFHIFLSSLTSLFLYWFLIKLIQKYVSLVVIQSVVSVVQYVSFGVVPRQVLHNQRDWYFKPIYVCCGQDIAQDNRMVTKGRERKVLHFKFDLLKNIFTKTVPESKKYWLSNSQLISSLWSLAVSRPQNCLSTYISQLLAYQCWPEKPTCCVFNV